MKKFLALVLGGGSAKGLAHIGILKALEQEKIFPDVIGGTSMGGIIGALYATEPSWEYVYEKAKQAKEKGIFKKFGFDIFSNKEKNIFRKFRDMIREKIITTMSFLKESVISFKDYESAMLELFKDIKIEDLKIPLYLTAFDLVKGELIVFNKGSLARALMATSAITGYLPPVKIEDRFLVDGGALFSTPVNFIKVADPCFILVSHTGGELEIQENFKGTIDYLMRLNTIARHRLQKEEFKSADFIVSPDFKGISWADFHKLDELVKIGYNALYKVLPSLRAHILRRKIRYFFSRR